MIKKPLPKDTNLRAKAIVDIATGTTDDTGKSARVLPMKTKSGHRYVVFENLPTDQQKAWKEVMGYPISSAMCEGDKFTPNYADYDAFYDWWVYGTPVTHGWFKAPK